MYVCAVKLRPRRVLANRTAYVCICACVCVCVRRQDRPRAGAGASLDNDAGDIVANETATPD